MNYPVRAAPRKKILIIEDERSLSKILKYNLEKEGYETAQAFDGESGVSAIDKENPDLVLLDIMLPKKDGLEILRVVRSRSKLPVIVLTAKNDEIDRVLGLEIGADDYVTKPFSVRELMARIKAIFRRAQTGGAAESPVLRAGSIELDQDKYEVRVKGKPVALSAKEFEFLKCLFEARGKAMGREQILEKVWGYDRGLEIDTRTVDQHIARLREKLGPESDRVITIKNVGYRIKLD
ncbi:MAG: response regulator transcription factor [Elusimicrobiota bacterium]